MAYLVLSIPYLIAAGGVAVGINPYAALAVGYVLQLFVLHGFAAED